MTLDPQAHDRLRDRDVIEAAFLLQRLAGYRGISVDALVAEIINRVEQHNRDATNRPCGG